jgi:hypothetical protein
MTDQSHDSGDLSGTKWPAPAPTSNPGSNFVETRLRQMASQGTLGAPSSDAVDGQQQQQQTPPGNNDGDGGRDGGVQPSADDLAREYDVPLDVLAYKVPISDEPDAPSVGIDVNDARLPAAREAAKELGIDPATFGKVLQLDAKMTAAMVKRLNAETDAAVKSLGANFEAEKSAVLGWAQGKLSADEFGEFELFLMGGRSLPTRFRMLQRLAGLAGNAPPPIKVMQGGPAPIAYEKMSFEQRRIAQMMKAGVLR